MITTQSYRPDIDGLRALAVLLVVFHHFGSWVPGGFVGVDVFFVISGFLITGHIAEAMRAGTFTFRGFYKRRINRIVPPLLIVVGATLMAGLVVLSPLDYLLLTKSAVASLVGFSNVFFWKEYGNYFAGNAAEAPLLHTWSLGVEEQFYFAWPLLCVLLLKLPQRLLLPVLGGAVAAGLAFSQFALSVAASASYYLMPTRFFELLVGGALAIGMAGRSQMAAPPIFGWLGLAMIAGSAALLDGASPFPGLNALWPCLGAALLIAAGGVGPLRTRLVVGLGLISYSLYLWHWPLIAYAHYMRIEITAPVAVGVFALALGLSYVTWLFVEGPARRSGNAMLFARVFALRFALPVVAVGVLTASAVASDGFVGRFPPQVAALERAALAKPDRLRSGCHVPTALYATPPQPDRCWLGVRKANIDAALLGDSYANHYTGMLDVMARQAGMKVVDYTMDACPPLLGYAAGKAWAYAQKCKERTEAALRWARERHIPHIILGGSWPDTPEAGSALLATVRSVAESGAAISIIMKNESIPGAESCAVRAAMRGATSVCAAPLRPQPAYMQDVARLFPAVKFIDPTSVMCPGGECQTVLKGVLLYRDEGHLNDVGSRLVGQMLLEQGIRLL